MDITWTDGWTESLEKLNEQGLAKKWDRTWTEGELWTGSKYIQNDWAER